MMPFSAIILIVLSIYAITLPKAKESLTFMFKPDFSQFDKTMILTALGQALFTLILGIGAMITYGSYMKENTNIVKSAYQLDYLKHITSV